jgi:ubiquinone/menaquinone biosynthesis C-methylase UbiE
MTLPDDSSFSGSIPDIYDRFMVPLIFAPYAQDLAGRAARLAPRAVLETAAGTGVLTRALAATLPASVSLVATDLNQPMLDKAAARQPEGRPIITWQQADAQALPFPDSSFDLVLCQFGVMFLPDKVAGYREALRVLKPGGKFLFSVWDRIEENDFTQVVRQALRDAYPDDPAAFMARTPHGHFDTQQIHTELQAAGFSDIAIETRADVSHAASAHDAAFALCQGTPVRNALVAADPARLDAATRIAAQALARRFGDGAIEGRIQAHIVSAAR